MKRTTLLWIFSVVLTLSLAIYQRMTGPTYPLRGKIEMSQQTLRYKLDRSHSGDDAQRVSIPVPSAEWGGTVEWKRFKTQDAWQPLEMRFVDGKLQADLPGQPPAGKLQYRVLLNHGGQHSVLPGPEGVVTRFKGRVPAVFLVPHVIAMFMAMLLATRTGVHALVLGDDKAGLKRFTLWTAGLFTFGGMTLGPIVQLYAFGALWTGFPFGTDLTDNKTAIAWLGWLIAIVALYRFRRPARWVIGAVVVMWGVYLIPHSMFGSELDYNKLDNNNGVQTEEPPR